MKVKTNQASGPALDWMVARAMKAVPHPVLPWQPSTDWAQGGPIIEREGIWTRTTDEGNEDPSCLWRAEQPYRSVEVGPTPLIAAMRCYVASKMGDEMEVPDELA